MPDARLGWVDLDVLGYFLWVGKGTMLVCSFVMVAKKVWNRLMVFRHVPDLLAVRKIPLKRHAYLEDSTGGSMIHQDGDDTGEDPAVSPLLNQIRNVVLQDRDLHEKVRIPLECIPSSTRRSSA